MFFAGIYVNTWFIFSVSILIVLHSMLFSDDKVTFGSFIILFKFSKFIFVLVLVFALCCLGVWRFYFQKLAVHFG